MTNDKTLFLDALPVMQQLTDHGYEAYFVGGSVRDFLMGRPINDIDITTNATPDEIEALFVHTIPVGKEHGTINVVWNGINYEITTFRTEGVYLDHRRPSHVSFVRDLYQDVERRDFTINAIAMDQHFNVLDYFEGQQDINNQLIRTVGDPHARFEEDALRILRGLRFQAQLGFTIDTQTYNAMAERAADISHLAIERIMVELEKLLNGAHVIKTFTTLADLHIWDHIVYFKDMPMKHIQISSPVTLPQFLAIVMYQSTQSVKTKQLKRSKDEIKHAERLLRAVQEVLTLTSKQALQQFVYDYGLALCNEILAIQPLLQENNIPQPSALLFNGQTITETWNTLSITNRQQLAIDGKMLISAFDKKAGPWLKDALRLAECAVVQQQIANDKQEIIEWVRANVKIS
ncbi:CCA tRNA nucleotidyltransferase [Staphylococcus americanisciuri]|uniref:CCA-adding enzyme n=1 Tax=Staphylococcus americanisciuri TaxID=2973940 RepID=A0ABT2EYZ0_9STAP|nr:CCA tRNA nucleotidyltransferase [Staphylococcus americanisciuri]MCS4485449.1 CCA tRNA nucleotidyltransferase [Staphylococcus americanisciuri]